MMPEEKVYNVGKECPLCGSTEVMQFGNYTFLTRHTGREGKTYDEVACAKCGVEYIKEVSK